MYCRIETQYIQESYFNRLQNRRSINSRIDSESNESKVD